MGLNRRQTSWLVVALILGIVASFAIIPCLVEVRDGEGWIRSQNSLKGIGLAIQNYHEVHGKLPPAVVRNKAGHPLYSWRVLLLPYLEQAPLYEQFRLDEPWDSSHNKPLTMKTPWGYTPILGGNDAPGFTRYQVFNGPGTAFESDGLTWNVFPDGTANTLLVVEAAEPVPWAKPIDLQYDPAQPLTTLGGAFTKPIEFLCWKVGRATGFNAVFADGSTDFIRDTIGESAIRGMITRNGGEPVELKKRDSGPRQ